MPMLPPLYAITPDAPRTQPLLDDVEVALRAGVRLLQYRNKMADADLRARQIPALVELCRPHSAWLVLNDDWALAPRFGVEAVHLGRDDGDPAEVRRTLGPLICIGVSCYASLERAAQCAPHADWLAFGALFASGTKPHAPNAPLALLAAAQRLQRGIIGIGGITAANIAQVLAAGAQSAATVRGIFDDSPEPALRAARIRANVAALLGAVPVAGTGVGSD